MKNSVSKVTIIGNNNTTIKEIINEEEGRIIYIVNHVGRFFAENKAIRKIGGDKIFDQFDNLVCRDLDLVNDRQVDHNYYCPIVSSVQVREGDTFDKRTGERIAWAKLMKKAYLRLGKMACFLNNYYEEKLESIEDALLLCAKESINWNNKIQKFDNSANS